MNIVLFWLSDVFQDNDILIFQNIFFLMLVKFKA